MSSDDSDNTVCTPPDITKKAQNATNNLLPLDYVGRRGRRKSIVQNSSCKAITHS